jgi:alpha-mannosidase
MDSEMETTFDPGTMRRMVAQALAGGGTLYGETGIRSMYLRREGDTVFLTVSVGRGAPSPEALAGPAAQLQALLDDGTVERYVVRMRENEALEVAFVARDVPPLGYATYRWLPRPPTRLPVPERPNGVIENEYFRVEADLQTGWLTVTDKETGLVLPGVHRFVDGGDRGDEYNYCPPEEDVLVDRPAAPPLIRREANGVGETLILEMVYRVPESLTAERRRSDRLVDLSITTRVTLTAGVRRVDFETTVENTAQDHRLRVHFPMPFAAERAYAEGHWDVVEWPTEPPIGGPDWAEQPAPTRPQRGWACLSDGRVGVTVANRGLPEVEARRTEDRAEIALTLLRCVGWLSRDDFPCRRGHAGPGLAVPGAQCPGRHTFRYALIPHAGDWRAAFAEADAFQTDLRALATPPHPGSLPPALSFVQIDPPTLRLSALKPPEEGEGLILRIWNIEDRPVEGTIRFWRPFARAARVNMAEAAVEELASATDTLRLPVGGREVVTVRIEFP